MGRPEDYDQIKYQNSLTQDIQIVVLHDSSKQGSWIGEERFEIPCTFLMIVLCSMVYWYAGEPLLNDASSVIIFSLFADKALGHTSVRLKHVSHH